MSRKRSGWRAAERTYRWLTNELKRKAAEEIKANRERAALTVCPDGLACQDPKCVAARAVFMRGGDWKQAIEAANKA